MSDEAPDHELDTLKKRVELNPTDLMSRFELGESLFRRGRYKEAIPELQKARMNPHCRKQAMEHLAESYQAIGLHDLSSQTRTRIDFEFPEDDRDSGGAGVPARLDPIRPRDSPAAKKLPPNEEENA